MKKVLLTLSMFLTVAVAVLPAQEEKKEGWKYGVGIGADFSQLLFVNPRIGSGDNRIGFGGSFNVFANYQKGRLAWKNGANWLFGIQRVGSKSNPFQKNTDQLRVGSSFAYALQDSSKFAYAADALFLTQVTPTYTGNLLKDTTSSRFGSISHFLAPATFTFTPGIEYRPEKHLTVLLSPVAVKAIIVADDRLASIPSTPNGPGIHGNPWNSALDYQNTDFQLGGSLVVKYENKFFKDRLGVNSRLSFYTNYLRNPQNIDIEWLNSFDLIIFKGLSLNLTINVLYDDDIPVQVDRNDDGIIAPGELGKRPFLTEALQVKYSVLF